MITVLNKNPCNYSEDVINAACKADADGLEICTLGAFSSNNNAQGRASSHAHDISFDM